MVERITVLCHIYYENSLDIIKPYLYALKKYKVNYYFNVCSETSYSEQLVTELKEAFNTAIITSSTNVGKDIGGKLVLIDTYIKLKEQADYLILLHDKISPHTSLGTRWREKLFSILEPASVDSIMQAFAKSSTTGLIAGNQLIRDEYHKNSNTYQCTSNEILHGLRNKYSITAVKHSFIAGTMFWVRAKIYEDFFSTHQPLQVRSTLEKGNIQDQEKGSFAHAWERMFSWIVYQQGFNIKGV